MCDDLRDDDKCLTIPNLTFQKPTPIQSHAWPIVLQGIDLPGVVQTGTGKILFHLVPGFTILNLNQQLEEEGMELTCWSLDPLKNQLFKWELNVLNILIKVLNSVCIYGGRDREGQIQDLTIGVDHFCNSQLNYLQRNTFVSLKSVAYLVSGEAERCQLCDLNSR